MTYFGSSGLSKSAHLHLWDILIRNNMRCILSSLINLKELLKVFSMARIHFFCLAANLSTISALI